MILNNKNVELKDLLFFLICACIPFDNIPKLVQFNFWGGPIGNQFGVYFIFLGFILTLFSYKGKINLTKSAITIFFSTYLIISLVSTINGLIIYPYYDQIFNAPVIQIEKLPWLYSKLQSLHIPITQKELLGLWIVVRSIKSDIFNLVYTFGFSYMIFFWYRKNSMKCYQIFWKGMLISLAIFIIYGFIDVAFQMGSTSAQYVLEKINPLLHPIAVDHDWWPPLLWNGQVRSVFSEPSRIGNYTSFVLPFLFIPILNKTQHWKAYLFLVFLTSYLVFMTKARTAVAMLLGILLLAAVMTITFGKKQLIKRYASILLVAGVAFVSSVSSIVNLFPSDNHENNSINQEMHEYLADNVGSLASQNKRSNVARYALIKSNIKTGLQHPIFGVGYLLNGAYTVANFDEFDMTSGEVQKWVTDYYALGPLKSNFDAMNAYVTSFSTTGILGFLCLITPFVYGIVLLFKKIFACQVLDKRVRLGCLLISLIASLVAGCNGSLTLIYAVWILLAIIYLVVLEDSTTKEKCQ
jgi:hypothetical protein